MLSNSVFKLRINKAVIKLSQSTYLPDYERKKRIFCEHHPPMKYQMILTKFQNKLSTLILEFFWDMHW
ncbi:hypothetical protein AN687_26155 [Klebsiella variicola]|nr:hypothetical protein AN687_26155 [Klebsiella variicola]SXF23439.1 Uncharacterised protein [Klebsiella variicola]SXG96498.1 Uncharacterised protein [Klebsiella variicola]